MKKYLTVLSVILILNISCNSDSEIKRLLSSSKPYENIKGAYKARKSGNRTCVPLLLKNSGKQQATTALYFKGVTVYEESMYALEDLLNVNPPNSVNNVVDSVNIKFFVKYWEQNKLGK